MIQYVLNVLEINLKRGNSPAADNDNDLSPKPPRPYSKASNLFIDMEFLSPPLAKSILPYILSFVLLATHRLDSETLPVYVTLAFAILSVIWNLGFPAYARGLFPKDDIQIFIHFSLYNISIYLVVMLWCESKLTLCHGPL